MNAPVDVSLTLVCKCAGRKLLKPNALPLGGAVVEVDDLCALVAAKDQRLADWALNDQLHIVACHPRAVRALFDQSGTPLPATVCITDQRADSFGTSGDDDLAWFPVIDQDRCSQCGQCFEFCLFGIYEKDAMGRVVVANPLQCKNNCPACARICPEVAIIFPKIAEAPLNGADIVDEALERERVKLDVDQLLGNDVYAALAARGQKRRALVNRRKLQQALLEREHCSRTKS